MASNLARIRRLIPNPPSKVGLVPRDTFPADNVTPLPEPKRDARPLGKILVQEGALDRGNMAKAFAIQRRQESRFGEILLARGWITQKTLTQALCRQWRTNPVNLQNQPPDPRLTTRIGADFCLARGLVPWRSIGKTTFIATARPEQFEEDCQSLPAEWHPFRMLIATEAEVQKAVLASQKIRLIRRAEATVEAQESCRSQNPHLILAIAILSGVAGVYGLWTSPVVAVMFLTLWAALTLLATMSLKIAAFSAALREDHLIRTERGKHTPQKSRHILPVISVMVPLFNESDIAGSLIARLSQLDYPRELTDILLVIEETDHVTCKALQKAQLPHWIRVVQVPDGPIKTKPRALNYALNLCRGQIIGIWDAEDRPEPDQLYKVALRFAHAPPDVACLQGALDYYNPKTNWLARCFTAEYASWFRAVLPGVARLGLVVPLGGTTLFFRRDLLEKVGAWDAWNVTEDADLGVRLARRGYRTEILHTTTHEEANCRALPWVKQRSRWLKGYAMTWGVHMRDPVRLWKDLGPKRFLAFQVQFLGTISQYLLAPVLWSFWLLPFGFGHPLQEVLSHSGLGAGLLTLFVASELLNVVVAVWACRKAPHRHLWPWIPSLSFYFPLGCLAGWKAIYEVVAKPFYWDKTAHGVFGATDLPSQEHEGAVQIPVIGRIS